jgi:hypothetical protein
MLSVASTLSENEQSSQNGKVKNPSNYRALSASDLYLRSPLQTLGQHKLHISHSMTAHFYLCCPLQRCAVVCTAMAAIHTDLTNCGYNV